MAFDKNSSKFVPRRVLEVSQVNSDNKLKFTLGTGTISNGKVNTEGEVVTKTDSDGATMFVIPKGKTCNVTFDVHVADLALFAAMNGTSRRIGSNDAKIRTPKVETIDITSDNLTSVVLEKPVINDGTISIPNYNITVAVLTTDGSLSRNLTQGAAVDADVFTYTSGSKTLAFEADTLEVGNVIKVIYEYETADAAAITVSANQYPVAGKTIFRVEGCTVCNSSEVIDVWYVFPSALLSTQNEIDMGDPEAVVSVTMSCAYDYCSSDKKLYDIILAED